MALAYPAGSGPPAPTATPASLTFPATAAPNTSAAQSIVFSSNHADALLLTISGPFVFPQGGACPATPCTVELAYVPPATYGAANTGQIVATDILNGASVTVPLTGTNATPSQLTFAPNPLAFPAQPVGTSSTQTIQVANAGTYEGLIASAVIAGGNASDFAVTNACTEVTPGGSCSIGILFTPSAVGTRTITLVVTSNSSSSPNTIQISGSGAVPPAFTVSPASLNFGSLTSGFSSAAQTLTLTNTTSAAVGVSAIALSGANPGDFSYAASYDNDGSVYVPAGSSVPLTVTFTPAAAGARSASLVLTNTSSTPSLTVALSGTGVAAAAGPAALLPAALSFGATGVPQIATLTNQGTATLNISAISILPTPPSISQNSFFQTNTCGAALAPGAQCTISVTAQASSYQATATLQVIDDAAAGPQTVALSASVPNGGFPVSLNFGGWSIGAQGATSILYEAGAVVANYSFALTGTDVSDFSLSQQSTESSGSCSVFNQYSSCNEMLYFNPSALGVRSAVLTVTEAGVGVIGVIQVSGTGDPPGVNFELPTSAMSEYTPSPPAIAFGNDPVGNAVTWNQAGPSTPLAITNTGTVPLTLSSPVVSGAASGDFTASAACSNVAPGAIAT